MCAIEVTTIFFVCQGAVSIDEHVDAEVAEERAASLLESETSSREEVQRMSVGSAESLDVPSSLHRQSVSSVVSDVSELPSSSIQRASVFSRGGTIFPYQDS